MNESTAVRWMSVFLDVEPAQFDTAARFWSAVTDTSPGPPLGRHDEFTPLVGNGDACLWLQRTEGGASDCHPDLYVEDVHAASAHVAALGARTIAEEDGLVVSTSPGRLPFCLVTYRGQRIRPTPVGSPGSRGVVDQVCFDIPPQVFDAECDFWSALTGWPRRGRGEQHSEFDRLTRPAGIPYAVLLQRLDDQAPRVTAHLDLACEDRDTVTDAHVGLGAEVTERTDGWTVTRDPTGRVYCNTDRKPGDV
ncbi:MAG TPA: VOC family protein [Nocardioidaceae bacterium]|nr:VOC family protein [Nocardioidaceae bacterium]